MNLRLVSKLLGVISFLTGGMMLFSLPWAHPALGQRLALNPAPPHLNSKPPAYWPCWQVSAYACSSALR